MSEKFALGVGTQGPVTSAKNR